MSNPRDFPYDTRIDVKYGSLERINIGALAATVTHPWFNQTLCKVNGSVVRLGVLKGEYHWHKHEEDDEFFFVLEGRFLIDLEDRVEELGPLEGFVVPRGVTHRTRAPERTLVLMVETAAIVPTGD